MLLYLTDHCLLSRFWDADQKGSVFPVSMPRYQKLCMWTDTSIHLMTLYLLSNHREISSKAQANRV